MAKPSAPIQAEYFILDSTLRRIGNVKLSPGQKSVVLTEEEARFFVAGGALSTQSPKDKAASAPAKRA